MSNIPSYEEIEAVIHSFYKKTMANQQLGHFFDHLEDIEEHEKRIAGFWWISMGGKLDNPPKIDMIGKHFPLGIKQDDLEVWIALFSETLEQELTEDKALFWMDKVMTIAARLKQIVIDNQSVGVQIKSK
ncbi:MAG: group III truncated hemoglobin [Gammaproteobacteria bacterium]|nr:group III truncated hemoglobin [Gammaproteobacteria bacterium]